MPERENLQIEPSIKIRPSTPIYSLELDQLWEYRELLFFLIWRDVTVLYKQTLIGAAWAIIQPTMTMVIFTVVFSRFAKVSSEGFPYPIFAFTALLPWQYFANAVNRSGVSLVGSSNLISKVYFPRLIIPISAAIAPIVDFCIAFFILIGMMLFYGIQPTLHLLLLPLFLLIAFVTALGVGLWISALHVRYRDVGHAMPFLIQLWLYASPVAYSINTVTQNFSPFWQWVYSLNPMVAVVEGFRWALLGTEYPPIAPILISMGMVLIMLITGLVFFKRTESIFADVI
jgi:lipopolysaccharide transport system permease protein